MPTAADRLAQAHQRDVALVAGGVSSAVGSAALGADPTSISFWFQSAVDALITRIQAGYALNRRSAMGYLPQHAALNRASVSPVPGSLNIGSTRARLGITGPVAFKNAIAAGAYQHEALASMATQMSGVAEELVRNGDRDVIVNTIRRGKGLVAYRRRLAGKSCGFCSMIASRGAVYTAETSTFRTHPHCRCWAEPLYRHEPEPIEVQRLQRQWRRVTAGKSGSAAQREWRKHWEQRATPAARAREGIPELVPRPSLPAPSLPGGSAAAGAARPLEIRQILLDARTTGAVDRAFEAEALRITGRTGAQRIRANFEGSAATAREHAEGLLRGLERFPEARLQSVGVGPVHGGSAYAQTGGRGVDHISFNYEWSKPAARKEYLDSLAASSTRQEYGLSEFSSWHPAGTGTPSAVALHEFGHVLDIATMAGRIAPDVEALVRARTALGAPAGVPDYVAAKWTEEKLIRHEISQYANTNTHELVAEAFSDVMANGPAASRLSRDIFDLLEAEYRKGGYAMGPGKIGFSLPAPTGLSGKTVTELRALAKERGLTGYSKLTKPQLLERLGGEGKPAVADLLGRRGLSSDAITREVQIENRVRVAYNDLPARPGGYVMLSDLRGHPSLSRLSRDDVDAALLRGNIKGMQLSTFDNTRALTDQDRRAALDIGGNPRHMISYRGPSRSSGAPLLNLPSSAGDLSKLKVAELRALAKERGVAGYSKLTKPQLLEQLRKPAPTPEDLLVTAARERQATIDYARARAELLSETEEWLNNQGSLATMAVQLRRDAKRFGIEGHKDVAALFKAIDAGDKAKVRRAIEAVAKKQKLARVEKAGELVRYDRALHGDIGKDLKPGEWAIVVRPGYTFERNGEVVRLHKAKVEKATAQEIAAAQRASRRKRRTSGVT